jgi:hypothetical protein
MPEESLAFLWFIAPFLVVILIEGVSHVLKQR